MLGKLIEVYCYVNKYCNVLNMHKLYLIQLRLGVFGI